MCVFTAAPITAAAGFFVGKRSVKRCTKLASFISTHNNSMLYFCFHGETVPAVSAICQCRNHKWKAEYNTEDEDKQETVATGKERVAPRRGDKTRPLKMQSLL